jgi:hypothetical protein
MRFQGIHINQPHLADFAAFQRPRTQYPPQVLDVVAAMECSCLDGYAIIENNWDS